LNGVDSLDKRGGPFYLLHVPDVHSNFTSPDFLSFCAVWFSVLSLEQVNANRTYVELDGGVIVQSTKDGKLRIFGVYALCRGAGNLDPIWLDSQIVESKLHARIKLSIDPERPYLQSAGRGSLLLWKELQMWIS